MARKYGSFESGLQHKESEARKAYDAVLKELWNTNPKFMTSEEQSNCIAELNTLAHYFREWYEPAGRQQGEFVNMDF